MKIAIICDWLVSPGGAEKVLDQLLSCYPQADLFAVLDQMDPQKRGFLRNKPVKTTFIQKFPFVKKHYRTYLPFMPLAVEQLDLSSYELVISSSHAVAKGIITGPHQLHISYTHTPMRYAWDLQHHYLQETGLDKKLVGYLARYFLHRLRAWDLQSALRVDHFIANSQFIARRIMKTYRRSALVIYPPVDLTQFHPSSQKEEFYLAASRLVPYKKMDLIVESFQAMPDKKLMVIGEGPDANKIKRKAGSNVEILGALSKEKLTHYLQRAKALIFAAEEDFGLIPVEAQACGTPVIAYGKGGVLETVRDLSHDHPTGVFFNEQNIAEIIAAIKTFETHQALFTLENCVENAKRFSTHHFQTQFKAFVDEKLKEFFNR